MYNLSIGGEEKMGELYNDWNNKRVFKIEHDRFKPKRYLYTTPYQVVNNGFNNKNLFPTIFSDVLNKAYRMKGYNVMYPVICNNLNDITYSYSRLRGEGIEALRRTHRLELCDLNVGFDSEKEISLSDNTSIKFVQQIFKEMYSKGYIKLKRKEVFTDFTSHQVYPRSCVELVNDKYIFKDSKEDAYVKTMDVFVIDLSKFDGLIKNINDLKVDDEIKNKIFDFLGCKKGLSINIKNHDFSIKADLDNPELIGGISFIALNPKLIDVLMYTTPDEYISVSNYVLEESDMDCFTGVVLKNPLTFKDIYVFASYKYDEAIHVGIPTIDTLDYMFASSLGLDPNICLDDDRILVQSDFLDGLSEDMGREEVCNAFTQEGMGSIYLKPSDMDLIITSFNDLGILIPAGVDYLGEITVLDDMYYPIYFNNRFKPCAFNEDKLDNRIQLSKMTFNRGFVLGLSNIYAKMYDSLTGGDDFYNSSSIYNDFNETIGILYADTAFEEVLYNIIFNMYFKDIGKEYNPYKRVFVINENPMDIDSLGEQQRLGVSFVNEILERYSSDAYRLYLLSNNSHSDDLKETLEALDLYKGMLQEIKKAFEEPFLNQAFDNIYFTEFVKNCNKLLEQFEIVKLTKTIMTFFKSFVLPHNISKDEAHRFLIIFSIICPEISETINKEVFNDRYSIFYQEFPKI